MITNKKIEKMEEIVKKTMIESERKGRLIRAREAAAGGEDPDEAISQAEYKPSRNTFQHAAKVNIRQAEAHARHARAGGRIPAGEAAEYTESPSEAAEHYTNIGRQMYERSKHPKRL